MVLAEPIVRLLFEHGRFTAASTDRAALALMCLAPGLVTFSTVNILARAFYALGDTKTPMKISLVCLALNLFSPPRWSCRCGRAAPASPTPSTSVCNVGLLLFALAEKAGQTRNGFVARHISAAGRRRHRWPG